MLSFCHLLNDLMQSMIPAIYPMLKRNLDLSFTQIGLITLAFQLSASMLQPAVGLLTDRRPLPYSLIGGMFSTLIGLLMLSQSGTYIEVLPACVLIGVGSAIQTLSQLASSEMLHLIGRYRLHDRQFK